MTLQGMSGNYVMGGGPPKQFVGFPGELARIALNDRWFTVASNGDDAALKRLELFHDVVTDATADRKLIAQLGTAARNQFVDLAFTHYEYGASNGNNGAAFTSLGGVNRDQFLHNIEVTGAAGTVIQVFKHRNSLFQKIRIHDAVLDNPDNSSSNGAIRLKDGWGDLTVRLCEAWNNNTWGRTNSFINLHGQDQSDLGIGATDICYNRGFHPSDGNRDGSLTAWSYGTPPTDTDDIHIYRNSFAGLPGENCYTADIGINIIAAQRDEKNVFQEGQEAAAATVTQADNLSGSMSFFDADLALTGTYRENNLGTHGAEIAMPSR